MTCSANVQNNYVFVPFTPHHLMKRTALYFTMQLERKSIARLLRNAECGLKRSLTVAISGEFAFAHHTLGQEHRVDAFPLPSGSC